jgi:TolB-like protein/Tfp pilus assembly protein PilF
LNDLLRAIEARMDGAEPAPAVSPANRTTTATASKTGSRRVLIAAAFAVAMVVGYAALQLWSSSSESPASAAPAGDPTATDTAVTQNQDEPRIAVAPIRVRGSDPQLENFASSLGEDIASGLSRFSYLLVTSQAPSPGQSRAGAAYVLEGTLRRSGDTLRLSTQLLNAATGQQVWGETYDRPFDAGRTLEIQDDLTDRVVASVADPYGALMRDLSRPVALKSPEQMTPYETVLRHFIYRQRIGAEDHLVARAALERSVELAPGNANVWASLAALYAEEYKHDFNPRPDPLERALEAARTAVDLEPDNAWANFALAEVHYFSKNVGAFRAAAERAISLNPRDSDAMAMIGIMVGYTGDWDRSLELTSRAMELNPTHPGWYRFNRLFNEYRQQNYAAALEQAERINMPDYFADPYTRAMIHAQLGNMAEAEKALDEFRALWPGITLRNMRESHMNKWLYAQPELINAALDGLRKAGLEEG